MNARRCSLRSGAMFMLDDVVHKHLDEMDAMKAEIVKSVDKIIDGIDIEELMNDPEGYLLELVDFIKEEVMDPLSHKALQSGEDFAKAIESKDEIIVDDSKDPHENKT
jgi:hypothetical protein